MNFRTTVFPAKIPIFDSVRFRRFFEPKPAYLCRVKFPEASRINRKREYVPEMQLKCQKPELISDDASGSR